MATIKQKKALKNLVENGGNVSQAMLDAGYSPATAKTPQKLTKSIGFEELVEEYLPDYKLLNVHKEGLEATRTISAQVIIKSDDPKIKNKQATARDIDFIDVPDFPTRLKAVELGYKVKRKLVERVEHEGEIRTKTIVELPPMRND